MGGRRGKGARGKRGGRPMESSQNGDCCNDCGDCCDLEAWTCLDRGEDCCCSGIFIQPPCLNQYAPVRSCSGICCCCCPQVYDAEEKTLASWVQDILPELHTGDVVLTSWPRGVYRDIHIARCCSHSRWTSIGLVYRPSDCPDVLKKRDGSCAL